MQTHDLQKLIDEAVARFKALTPEQQADHRYEQKRSFVRGMCPDHQDYAKWCDLVDRILPPLRTPQHRFICRLVDERSRGVNRCSILGEEIDWVIHALKETYKS